MLDVGLAAAATLIWLSCLLWPGWVQRAGVRARQRRWLLAATGVGLLAVALADPLLGRAPAAWMELLARAAVAPDLALRLLALGLAVAPLVCDALRPPGGTRTALRRLGRQLRAGAPALAPALAALVAARAAPDVWSHVLGGRQPDGLQAASSLLLGTRTTIFEPSSPDPLLPAVLYWLATAGVLSWWWAPHAAVLARGGSARLALRLAIALLVGGAVNGALRWAPSLAVAMAPLAWWVTATLAAVWSGPNAGRGWRERLVRPAPRLAGLLLGGCLLLGFQLRWDFLIASGAPQQGLSLDGQSYFDEALSLGPLAAERQVNLLALFFGGSTWFREPLFIYLVHGWMALLGPQELHQMYLSILASLAWVAVTAAAVGALLGAWPALLTALLLAIDGVWIRNAVIGLREEVAGTLLVAAVAVLFWRGGRWRLSWLAPLLAAAAGLTRLDALPCGLFVLGWAVVAQRWPLRRLAGMAALLALLLLPVFAGYSRSRGSAAPEATAIATNNWKQEFEDRLGTPGFEPDRQVTAFEYLFRYHTPLQLVEYTARGAAHIYGVEIFESLYYRLANASIAGGGWGRYLGLESTLLAPMIFLAGCAGLLSRWRAWRTHWLPPALCLVGVLPPIGFSAGVPGHMMYQARYGYLVAPFASAVVAWALCRGALLLRRATRRARGAIQSRRYNLAVDARTH